MGKKSNTVDSLLECVLLILWWQDRTGELIERFCCGRKKPRSPIVFIAMARVWGVCQDSLRAQPGSGYSDTALTARASLCKPYLAPTRLADKDITPVTGWRQLFMNHNRFIFEFVFRVWGIQLYIQGGGATPIFTSTGNMQKWNCLLLIILWQLTTSLMMSSPKVLAETRTQELVWDTYSGILSVLFCSSEGVSHDSETFLVSLSSISPETKWHKWTPFIKQTSIRWQNQSLVIENNTLHGRSWKLLRII